MNRKPRTISRKVKALTDPQPEFVSLVIAGANMTPFRVVKNDGEGEEIAPAEIRDATPEEAAQVEPSFKADTHDITAVKFEAERFPTEEAVKAWLENGGYEGFTVTKTDEGFSVGEDDTSTSREIKLSGMTIYVAQRETPSGEAIEKQPTAVEPVESTKSATPEVPSDNHQEATMPKAKKAADAAATEVQVEASALRVKFDDYYARYSDSTTLKGVMDSGFDGLPPGMYELTAAMYTAVKNNVIGNDLAAVKSVTTEYGDMIVKLAELFPAPMEDAQRSALVDALAPELVTEKAATVDEDVPAEEAAKSDEPAGDAPAGEPAADAAPAADAPADAAPAADAAADAPAADAAGDEAAEVTADKTADAAPEAAEAPAEPQVDATMKMIATLAASVEQLTKSVELMQHESVAKAAALSERVEAVENTRQVRRSADADEGATSKPVVEKNGLAEMAFRSALGISRRDV